MTATAERGNLAANVGLPLGATGFANLSLEYGSSDPTDRTAPRSDAIALLAAGNSDVPSDTPQVWGSPDIDDDLKLFGKLRLHHRRRRAGLQSHQLRRQAGDRRLLLPQPEHAGRGLQLDGGRTLLIGDALRAGGMGSANCPTVAITDNVADPVALQQVFDDPNCFSFRELFPGGSRPASAARRRTCRWWAASAASPSTGSTGT